MQHVSPPHSLHDSLRQVVGGTAGVHDSEHGPTGASQEGAAPEAESGRVAIERQPVPHGEIRLFTWGRLRALSRELRFEVPL